jgi:hypothetical protein
VYARVHDVITYLKDTTSFDLLWRTCSALSTHADCDSDFAACSDTRKSTTGYVVRCGLASVCSKAVWQATDSRSIPESETIAAGKEVKEQQHIHALAPQMGLSDLAVVPEPTMKLHLRLNQDQL